MAMVTLIVALIPALITFGCANVLAKRLWAGRISDYAYLAIMVGVGLLAASLYFVMDRELAVMSLYATFYSSLWANDWLVMMKNGVDWRLQAGLWLALTLVCTIGLQVFDELT